MGPFIAFKTFNKSYQNLEKKKALYRLINPFRRPLLPTILCPEDWLCLTATFRSIRQSVHVVSWKRLGSKVMRKAYEIEFETFV